MASHQHWRLGHAKLQFPLQQPRAALQNAWKPGLLHAPGLLTGAATAIHNLFVGREDAPGQAPAEDHPSQTASDDVRLDRS